jgi:hypothetical protein
LDSANLRDSKGGTESGRQKKREKERLDAIARRSAVLLIDHSAHSLISVVTKSKDICIDNGRMHREKTIYLTSAPSASRCLLAGFLSKVVGQQPHATIFSC